jgi:hypothetical protein
MKFLVTPDQLKKGKTYAMPDICDHFGVPKRGADHRVLNDATSLSQGDHMSKDLAQLSRMIASHHSTRRSFAARARHNHCSCKSRWNLAVITVVTHRNIALT